MRKATLRRDERLRGSKHISALFQKPRSVNQFPFRINWNAEGFPGTPFRVVFVVSSRKYRKAVTRNRIRRVMRELFRLHKHKMYEVLEAKALNINMALMYHGAEEVTYQGLLPQYLRLIDKFLADVQKDAD
ncbi:MAG: ribonuclease P protein component [Bacteroidetes bacterium]|nr:ribonuclease P protein component [Bacteroidota bacterium]